MMSENTKYTEQENEVFAFLDELRNSGVTNMFGASPYVASQFDLKSPEAKMLLIRWMKTFSERHPVTGGDSS